ncbi:MAG TPA: R3H domain-containing nucleic acid-binding protein [Candidatus Sulfotelmatobacter sp.]|nr:R3H domain-containing nucleic acid-binding protein [Candidatus Sulfotelmatobacter sp.]
MSENRTPAARGPRGPKRAKPSARENQQSEPRLDRERAAAELRRFLDLTLRETQLAVAYDLTLRGADAPAEEADIVVGFRGEDESVLLERNAELLLALEHIAHRWLRLDPRLHDRVRFDCGDYRTVRLDELKLSARVAAQRVRETGQPFRFNPMSSRDRRIIHLELNGSPGVRTISEGSGDRRQLVIYPAGQKK